MKTSKFQIIVISIFVICIIAGVAAFATYKNSNSNATLPAITVWGTFPSTAFDQFVSTVNNSSATQMTVKYTQKDQSSFLNDFVAALARGSGPDVVLIPADMLLPAEDKLLPIPYTAYPQASFMSAFVDEGRIYLGTSGLMGVPFSIDPLVMYWNRDMFNAAGIAVPPKHWSDLSALVPKLTVKDANGTISRSTTALGDFSNVDNAREILATLFMQLGNPITSQSATGGVTTQIRLGAKADPTPALNFFTSFVDPTDPNYSWNHSWPDSKTAFLSGNVAVYFGFASELNGLRAKNPNLNFDVSAMPQATSGGVTADYGKLYGFSIVKASPNSAAAFTVISTLTSAASLSALSTATYLPSVRRDVIAAGSDDPYLSLFDQEALIGRTWLDASPDQSNQIFGNIVGALTSGQKSVAAALQDGENQYNVALQQAVGQ